MERSESALGQRSESAEKKMLGKRECPDTERKRIKMTAEPRKKEAKFHRAYPDTTYHK